MGLTDGRRAEGVSVGPFIQSGEDGGAAGRTNGCGDEHVGETDAFAGESVHGRGLEDGMSSAAHSIPTMIVGEEKDDVGLGGRACGQG